MGVSYFCNKGQLGENEAVGNRTDMFSQETQRAIVRTMENKDPARAKTLKHIIEDAKPGLSQMLGIHVSLLTITCLDLRNMLHINSEAAFVYTCVPLPMVTMWKVAISLSAL